MDLYVLITVLLTMHSWILYTVLAVPAGVTPTALTGTPVKHVRTKRCSCATFLDKECVYFCHLDIIWVNTPERVVSYGLGSAPRTRRALTESMATGGGPRCQCFRQKDNTCRKFCRLEKPLRYGTLADTANRKHKLAADTGSRIKSNENRVSPQAIRTTLKTRLLLEKWKVRQRHRGRAQAPRDDR